ncbi:hypothetical protein [Xaviernesmea oryzae]|uniref:hypothetical protein n=1 Tax=Xaviernesmea oryzae TaxID=464029 RepID=UPI000A18B961|nr:hypothetical protein [Xaviernesmea oryzae]
MCQPERQGTISPTEINLPAPANARCGQFQLFLQHASPVRLIGSLNALQRAGEPGRIVGEIWRSDAVSCNRSVPFRHRGILEKHEKREIRVTYGAQ